MTEDRHVWFPAVFLNWLLMFSLMQTALLAIHSNATWFRPDSQWCTCPSLMLHARPCWKPLKPWRHQKFSWCCRQLTHTTLGLNICSMVMHPTQTSTCSSALVSSACGFSQLKMTLNFTGMTNEADCLVVLELSEFYLLENYITRDCAHDVGLSAIFSYRTKSSHLQCSHPSLHKFC